jgi:hypothetical protein
MSLDYIYIHTQLLYQLRIRLKEKNLVTFVNVINVILNRYFSFSDWWMRKEKKKNLGIFFFRFRDIFPNRIAWWIFSIIKILWKLVNALWHHRNFILSRKKKKETNFSDFIINLSKQNQLPVYLINKKKKERRYFKHKYELLFQHLCHNHQHRIYKQFLNLQ